MEADASQSHAGKKVNSYSTEFKLEAVRFAVECNSNYQAAKKFNVDRKRIREWRANQSKLESVVASESGSPGREETLLIWILKKCCLNGSTNDALMLFVYQGKSSEAKQGFYTRRNARKWNFHQHSRQALGGCRSS